MILYRIFVIIELAVPSPERKTKLANVTGLNYALLEDFLYMLRNHELIDIDVDGKSELVRITENGRKIHSMLTIVLQEFGIIKIGRAHV